MDPEEERSEEQAPNPDIADYTNDEQYQEQGQPTVSSGQAARNAADLSVDALLYKNAPKGSFLRKVQSGVRLARQKGFKAIRHPFQTVKDMGAESRAKQLEAGANRYQNILKDNQLTSPEKVQEYTQGLGRGEKDKFLRLQKRVGGHRDYFEPNNFIEPVEAPPIVAPPEVIPPIVAPPVVAPPIVAPPVVAEEAAKAAAGQGLRGVETKAVESFGQKVATRAALEGGKAAVKQGAVAAAGEAAATAGGAAAAEGAAVAGTAAATAGTLAAEAAVPVAGWIAAAATGLVLVLKSPKGRKVLGYILISTALVIIIPMVVFIFLAFGNTSLPNPPVTAAEKAQADMLAGAFGNPASLRKTILNDADSLIATLKKAQTLADTKYAASKAGSAKSEIAKVIADLELVRNQTDNATRAATAKKIETAIAKLNTDYPEAMGYSKNCADLAQYLTSGKINLKYSQDKSIITQGKVVNAAGTVLNVSPNICSTLSFLAASNYKIMVSTVAYGHHQYVSKSNNSSKTPVTSAHFVGRGMDIASINDSSVLSDPTKAKEVMQLLYNNRATLGITQILGPNFYWIAKVQGQNGLPTSETMSGHSNHIHLSVKGLGQ